jgi:ABC-type glycerol-3-phosphate transport system permease component
MDRFQKLLVFLLTLLAVFMLLPLVYMFNHAMKPYQELFLFPPNFLVREPTVNNFIELVNSTAASIVPLSRYFFNTVVVAFLAVSGITLLSAICAYPLSKHPFPGRGFLFMTIIVSLMFANETVQIPRYIVVNALGIMNTYWAHILPIIVLPVGVFLLKQFIDQLPSELLEAAKMDGASELRILLQIVIPLVMPAVGTVAIIAFQLVWGNVETSQLFMQDESMKTIAFYFESLTNGLANDVARQGAAAAAALIMFVPNLLIFLFFQSKVIATMAHSGIK